MNPDLNPAPFNPHITSAGQYPPYASRKDRIAAVLAKDSHASGRFVVALVSDQKSPDNARSTSSNPSSEPIPPSSLYCRPDCPTIPPNVNVDNLLFFDTCQQALQANFKPCVKCNPDLPVHVDASIVQQTVQTVNASFNIDIGSIAEEASNPTDPLAHPVQPALPLVGDAYSQPSATSSFSPIKSEFPKYCEAAISSPNSSPPLSQMHKFNTYGHSRTPSLAGTPPDQIEQEFWNSRPRRASIANGHISVVAAAVDEISKAEGNAIDFEMPSASSAGFSRNKSDSPSISQQQLQLQLQQQILQSNQIRPQNQNKRRDDRVSKGEGEHARLVSEACMHIAAAAAAAAAQAAYGPEDPQPDTRRRNTSLGPARSSSQDPMRRTFKPQRKKRRGGILGFKELAAKAGLSPWHFHRVFRSVTGLTPKAYGDACWNTVSNLSPQDLLENKPLSASSSPAHPMMTTQPLPPPQQLPPPQLDSFTSFPAQEARPPTQEPNSLLNYSMHFSPRNQALQPPSHPHPTSISPTPTDLSTPNTNLSSECQSTLGTQQTTPGTSLEMDPPVLSATSSSHLPLARDLAQPPKLVQSLNQVIGPNVVAAPPLPPTTTTSNPIVATTTFATIPPSLPTSSEHFHYVGNSSKPTLCHHTPFHQHPQHPHQEKSANVREGWSIHDQTQSSDDIPSDLTHWPQTSTATTNTTNTSTTGIDTSLQTIPILSEVDAILNSLEPEMIMMHIDNNGLNNFPQHHTPTAATFPHHLPIKEINSTQQHTAAIPIHPQIPSIDDTIQLESHSLPNTVSMSQNLSFPIGLAPGTDLHMDAYNMDFPMSLAVPPVDQFQFPKDHMAHPNNNPTVAATPNMNLAHDLSMPNFPQLAEFSGVSRPHSRLQALNSRLDPPNFDEDLEIGTVDDAMGIFAPTPDRINQGISDSGTSTPNTMLRNGLPLSFSGFAPNTTGRPDFQEVNFHYYSNPDGQVDLNQQQQPQPKNVSPSDPNYSFYMQQAPTTQANSNPGFTTDSLVS